MNDEITDSPEYSPKSDFSKAIIMQQAIIKTRESRGVEMKEGYNNFKFDKDNNAIKVWMPDTRKIFCANVDGDLSLLAPEIQRNKRALKVMIEFKKQKDALFTKYCYHERVKFKFPNGHIGWKLTGKVWMPRISESLPIEDPKHPNSKNYVFVKGQYDLWVNHYWDEMLALYDEMFGEINILIDELNYFKGKTLFG